MNKIFVISTPIGNLKDITERAKDELERIRVIFCEDTKVTSFLLEKLNIKNKKLISLHKYNEKSRIDIIEKFLENEDIAIVSDAGTPLISDPGSIIVNHFSKRGIKIIPIPGVSSIITFLSVSGLEFKNFSFLGFVPKGEQQIIEKINDNSNQEILVFFESPKRIEQTLAIIYKNFGDLVFSLGRELTKKFEEVFCGRISEFDSTNIKGEIVFAIKLNFEKQFSVEVENLISLLKEQELSNKTISMIIAKTFKINKNLIYNYLKNI